MTRKQQSTSYEKLSRAGRDKMDRLAERGLLDATTRTRCAHLGRFFAMVGQVVGQVADQAAGRTLLGDILSEDDLLKIWRDTADESASPLALEQRPLVH
jgi:hypothetical protein